MLKRWQRRQQRKKWLLERQTFARERQQVDDRLHDPIEDDPNFEHAILEAERLANEELAGVERGRGFCHKYWRTKQRILCDRFHVEWFPPSEMNPESFFD